MTEKKKLVIASDCFLPRWDGISRFLLDIIPELTDVWDITIIAPDFPGPQMQIPYTKILRIPLTKIVVGDFAISKRCPELIDPIIAEADLVWVNTLSNIGRTAIQLAKKRKKFVLFYIHSVDWELVARSVSVIEPLRNLINFTARINILQYYKKCNLILSPEQNIDEMLDWYGVKRPKVRITLGIDLRKFRLPESKEQAKIAIGLNPDRKVIGYCGRISREKSIKTLISGFRRIKNEHPEAQLLIVGDGLKEYTDILAKEENVLWVGAQDNVVPYLQAMDIFVLPSLLETTSLATLEAMACGAVPICTPVGYVKEYIKEKVNGMLFPLENDMVLALKLKWILENPQLVPDLSKAARQTVQERFNWENVAETIKKVLNNIQVNIQSDKPKIIIEK